MSGFKYPTKEQYKELDELMTYILDEMWETDDKQMIREGIIAYANKWHETQANGDETRASNCNIPLVTNCALCKNIKCTVDDCPYVYDENVKCPLHD